MMEMKKSLMLSLLTLVAVTMTSCLHVRVNADKAMPTQVHQVGQDVTMEAYDEIDVAGPFNVFYEQGDNYSVRVDGATDQLGKMTIYVKDGELTIRALDHVGEKALKIHDGDFDGMRIFLTAPAIKGVDLAGSGRVTMPGALSVVSMDIDLAGSGEVTLAQLTCTDLDVDVSGSGAVTTGPVKADQVDVDLAGSGRISMAALTCKKVVNDLAGSGVITLSNLDVEHVSSDIAGSGRVILSGHVGNHQENVVGSGKVDVTGLNP